MLLHHWLRARDGIAHTSDIYAAGFSRHAVSKEIDGRRMLRIRRSWIALRDCEPELQAAVRVGGRLTCVSAARRLGLWVPPDDTAVHVSVRPESGRHDRKSLVLHWGRGPAPTPKHATVEPLINTLNHVARCLAPFLALTIWESALNTSLISLDELRSVGWRGSRACGLAELAGTLADSGLETQFITLMRAIGVPVRQQVWIDGHPVDALIGDRLVVQLDGFAHHGDAASRRRDIEADARLRLRGYIVIRFDYFQLFFEPAYVQETIRTAIAQRLHLAR